jgi:uncharacterized protein YhhL (DUF1145 family)
MDQWHPMFEIGMGVATLIASLLIHGVGMYWVQRRNLHYAQLPPFGWRREIALSLLILMMVLTHVVEILLWGSALCLAGAIATFRDAYYYVAVTYTTLGYGEGTLTSTWRILAATIAMSGLFAFGWTTSVFFSIVGNGGATAKAAATAAAAAVIAQSGTATPSRK